MFGSKPSLYMQFMEKSIRYLVMDSQNKSLIEMDEVLFDTAIIQEGKVANKQLLENRLAVLAKEKKWKKAPVSIILPDDLVTIRNEELPAQLSKSEVEEYLNLHINESIVCRLMTRKWIMRSRTIRKKTSPCFLSLIPMNRSRL